ncbi:MAG: hypothetical protein RJR37_00865 [Peptococcaceae bacterium MAG4]|nr:hypothetical protein [Peptococcaceae bacterium MAG4]
MLKVYTAQYGYRGRDRLDITVRSGDKTFAPTWDMVKAYKAGKITQEGYVEMYCALMRRSYRNNRQRWEEILAMDRVVLVCFCRAGDFCHRLLLAEIMQKLGAEYRGEIFVQRS